MDSPKVSPNPSAPPPRSPANRTDARRWQLLGNRLLTFLGAAFLAAGLIFFFAYNWAELHRFGKFAVGFVAFLVSIGFALASKGRDHSARDRRAAPRVAVDTVHRSALFAATLCIGALLALIGQVYQTGADLWELFALWTVLALPFALLSRSVETWFLWLGVANTALILWLGQSWAFSSSFDAATRQLLCAVVFNAACLLLAERFAHAPLFTPNRALPRTIALLVLVGLCTGACVGVFSDDFAHFIPLFIAGAVLTLALYRHYRFDLVMLALGGTSAITFGTVAFWRLAERIGSWELGSMSCAAFLITTSGLLTAWLIKLHREQKSPTSSDAKPEAREARPAAPQQTMPLAKPDAAAEVSPPTTALRQTKEAASPHDILPTSSTPEKDTSPPLWINILQGIAAWVAASLLASSLAAPFWLFEGGVWFIAFAFIAGALVLFYKVRGSVFFEQAALALSFSGQTLLCISAAEHWEYSERQTFTLGLAVALALFALRTPLLHRTLCLLWAGTCLYLIAKPSYETHVLFGLGFSTLTLVLWLGCSRWAAHKLATPILSLAHASSLTAWVFLGWNYFYRHAIFWKKLEAPREFALLYSTGSAAILVGLVVWLCRPLYVAATERAKKQAALLLSAAGLFAALAYHDPALVLCAALLLATYAARQRAWFTAMLAALPLLIWQLYYSFEQTLLMRSLTLAGSGALLLGLRKAIEHLARGESSQATSPKLSEPFNFGPFQRSLTASAALVLALCFWGIWGNERTLAHGQPVLVELAPVDPRSLMQGDYMRLRYAIERDLLLHMPQRWAQMPRSGYAYIVLDEQNRAASVHSIGSQLSPLPEDTTLAVKLRGKPHSPSIAAEAFFFQEGHGKIYETAKWAELRVDMSGKALLLNLRDENFKILGETKR